jgi:DNA modification methylase
MNSISHIIDNVHHSDSLAFLKTLPDESVNSIITSPPYFGHFILIITIRLNTMIYKFCLLSAIMEMMPKLV